jgi:hypothetical protein
MDGFSVVWDAHGGRTLISMEEIAYTESRPDGTAGGY